MKYQVEILPQALGNIEAAYRWIANTISSEVAEAWYDILVAGIQSLETFPNRCPIAPESQEFQREIRQLLVGRGRQCYRVLFVVEQAVVFVLYVRHSSQAWLTDPMNDEN